jgi:hypothetical protein
VRFRFVARVEDRMQALAMIVGLHVHPPPACHGACGSCPWPGRARATEETIASPSMRS